MRNVSVKAAAFYPHISDTHILAMTLTVWPDVQPKTKLASGYCGIKKWDHYVGRQGGLFRDQHFNQHDGHFQIH